MTTAEKPLQTMSHKSQGDVNLNVSKTAIVVAVLAGLGGLVGAWFVLPYRVSAAEQNITVIQNEQKFQRDLLIRIDENVKMLREAPPRRP